MPKPATLIAFIVITIGSAKADEPLYCYQCNKTTPNESCSEESLLPCPSNRDRCVTHITKDAKNGYNLRRECGLGPCGFDDDMVNKGLGLQGCDMTKDEYFCVFCCKENGCNKDSGGALIHSSAGLIGAILLHLILQMNILGIKSKLY